jgi:UTP--glucose-1-phosphate uridylyltransferase
VKITDAVIPVAGLGTRLLPATRSQPKEMLPIIDRPVVQYVVEELAHSGITRILFVTGRRKRAIEDHFDADPELGSSPLIDPRSGLQIFYTRQSAPAGLGDAIAHADGFSHGAGIVVALGDAIIESGAAADHSDLIGRLTDAYQRTGACAAIAVREVPESAVSRYGIVVGEAHDGVIEVTDMLEKPDPATVSSRLAVAARYILSPKVVAELKHTAPDASGEIQVADAITALIRRGERVVAVPLLADERRHDIGTPESYAATFVRYALHDPRFGAAMRSLAAELLADG